MTMKKVIFLKTELSFFAVQFEINVVNKKNFYKFYMYLSNITNKINRV